MVHKIILRKNYYSKYGETKGKLSLLLKGVKL